jgi:DNA repair exonuclease SbcCD ATPase subunit
LQRTELASNRQSLETRIESTQAEIGRKYLQGDRSGIREISELRAEVDAVIAALQELDAEQKRAQLELERAKARDLRQQTARKRAELESLNARTGALLSKLGEFEGVTYSHSILSSEPRRGAWLTPIITPPVGYESVLEMIVDSPGRPLDSYICWPRSRKLRAEMAKLEIEAETIERRLAGL